MGFVCLFGWFFQMRDFFPSAYNIGMFTISIRDFRLWKNMLALLPSEDSFQQF